jgi:ATP-dependent DNA helicase RecQ
MAAPPPSWTACARSPSPARPQTLAELAGISGVGDRKLEHYGAAILELVAEAG